MNKDQQQESVFPVRRLRNYGAGILVVLFLSLGVAIIVYTNNIFPFYFIHLIAWIFGPLGIYTSLFALFAGRDCYFYLLYGVVMILVGLMAVTFIFIDPIMLIGVFLIFLALIGAVAYWRRK